MIGFQLGREYKLSVAEIVACFPGAKIISISQQVCIVDNLSQENVESKLNTMGGVIKAMNIECSNGNTFENHILDKGLAHEGKFTYGVSLLGKKIDLKKLLLQIKKALRADKISSRFINKDFKNLNAAQIIGEKLINKKADFSYISIEGIDYFGQSFWVQDINEYSKRDYAKSRDMNVGMLPPKLSQIMINVAIHSLTLSLGGSENNTIYDPFVGLGTILIEAKYMGINGLYGSDLNERMVETASNNTDSTTIEKLNAKFVHEVSFWNEIKDGFIVTEGFLGEVMTQKNVSAERITEQRKTLQKLYEAFFENLKKGGFTGTIVICFPFWEKKGKFFYFDEIYQILEKYCDILPYFSIDSQIKATKMGSLLYKREKQLVGREIFRLRIK